MMDVNNHMIININDDNFDGVDNDHNAGGSPHNTVSSGNNPTPNDNITPTSYQHHNSSSNNHNTFNRNGGNNNIIAAMSRGSNYSGSSNAGGNYPMSPEGVTNRGGIYINGNKR